MATGMFVSPLRRRKATFAASRPITTGSATSPPTLPYPTFVSRSTMVGRLATSKSERIARDVRRPISIECQGREIDDCVVRERSDAPAEFRHRQSREIDDLHFCRECRNFLLEVAAKILSVEQVSDQRNSFGGWHQCKCRIHRIAKGLAPNQSRYAGRNNRTRGSVRVHGSEHCRDTRP